VSDSEQTIPTADAPAASRGSAGGRAALITIDQGLSSVTNLLAVLWVAHVASAVAFGSFSLIILVYTFVLGLVHALVSMRVGVHPDDADHRPRQVLGSALVLGAGWGLLFAVIGAAQTLAGWSIGPEILTLGILLPALTLHDVGRAISIARRSPVGAIILDTTWLVLLVGSLVVIEVRDDARLFTLTLAWAGSGAVASLYTFALLGVIRPTELNLSWLLERWDQSWRLLVGNLTAAGSALIGASLIALVSSQVAVAAVRGSLLLGRPTNAVQIAVATSTAVEVAREQPDNRGLMRYQRRTMALTSVVAVVNVIALVAIPDWLGRAVLGNVWPVIAPLLLPVSLWLVLMAAQAGVPPVLIGRHQFQVAMFVQVVGGLLNAAALVAGAALGGTEGAVWGLVIGQAATTGAWWVGLLWYLRRG
jgi:O-antigen/teichoic acid export membrane protein